MVLSARFEEALVYATQLHAQQVRKGTPIPYIAHLLAVSSLALEHGADEDEAIAALLHDAVEDQGGATTLAEIRRRFGDNVADTVLGCSDTDVIPKPPWRERKETYLAHVASPSASSSVRLVSACDKLHNARSTLLDYRVLGEDVWSRFRGGKEGLLWYFRSLVDIFRFTLTGHDPLIEELDRTVSELERLANYSIKPYDLQS
jgi:GTP pyrophosphokinase